MDSIFPIPENSKTSVLHRLLVNFNNKFEEK